MDNLNSAVKVNRILHKRKRDKRCNITFEKPIGLVCRRFWQNLKTIDKLSNHDSDSAIKCNAIGLRYTKIARLPAVFKAAQFSAYLMFNLREQG